MNRRYQIIGKEDKEKLSDFLVAHGHFLVPMVELIERSRVAVDEVIEVLGRASIEAVLRLSAQGVAAALLAAEKNFRRIMGYRDLWMLEAHLRGEAKSKGEAA